MCESLLEYHRYLVSTHAELKGDWLRIEIRRTERKVADRDMRNDWQSSTHGLAAEWEERSLTAIGARNEARDVRSD